MNNMAAGYMFRVAHANKILYHAIYYIAQLLMSLCRTCRKNIHGFLFSCKFLSPCFCYLFLSRQNTFVISLRVIDVLARHKLSLDIHGNVWPYLSTHAIFSTVSVSDCVCRCRNICPCDLSCRVCIFSVIYYTRNFFLFLSFIGSFRPIRFFVCFILTFFLAVCLWKDANSSKYYGQMNWKYQDQSFHASQTIIRIQDNLLHSFILYNNIIVSIDPI